ncbi:MAG TPA: hypothetical protein PK913_03850 [Phenylobacterium sp.]|nr:hypothetical protein [Phenylobacterium sp.]
MATSDQAVRACSAWVIWAVLKREKSVVSDGMVSGAVARKP